MNTINYFSIDEISCRSYQRSLHNWARITMYIKIKTLISCLGHAYQLSSLESSRILHLNHRNFRPRQKKLFVHIKMVWISCILVPVFLYIWHKFIQPLVDRWYGKPKLESGKTDEKLTLDQKVSRNTFRSN